MLLNLYKHHHNQTHLVYNQTYLVHLCPSLGLQSISKVLRLFDVLPNFPFTTSETMRDYSETFLQRTPSGPRKSVRYIEVYPKSAYLVPKIDILLQKPALGS